MLDVSASGGDNLKIKNAGSSKQIIFFRFFNPVILLCFYSVFRGDSEGVAWGFREPGPYQPPTNPLPTPYQHIKKKEKKQNI